MNSQVAGRILHHRPKVLGKVIVDHVANFIKVQAESNAIALPLERPGKPLRYRTSQSRILQCGNKFRNGRESVRQRLQEVDDTEGAITIPKWVTCSRHAVDHDDIAKRRNAIKAGGLQSNLSAKAMSGNCSQRRKVFSREFDNVFCRRSNRRVRTALGRSPMSSQIDEPRRPIGMFSDKSLCKCLKISPASQDSVKKSDRSVGFGTGDRFECKIHTC